MRAFGLEPVVAVNRFTGDDAGRPGAEFMDFCEEQGVRAAALRRRSRSGRRWVRWTSRNLSMKPDRSRISSAELVSLSLSGLRLDPRRRSTAVARVVYGADGVDYDHSAETLDRPHRRAPVTAHVPVCMAKTQKSLSDTGSASRAAQGLPYPGQRGHSLGGRRLRRSHLRQDHDDARPTERACCRSHRSGRRWQRERPRLADVPRVQQWRVRE